MFFALIGPYWDAKDQNVDVLGREIYILLDVSSSMNTEDLRPSRLGKIKKELKKLIYDLRGDRIGLIVFSAYPYVQCPLTQDFQSVSMFLDLATTEQFSNKGTNYRQALRMALERLIDSQKTRDEMNRAIILVSDGGDHGETYMSIIDRLQQANIKVFTVGVGTDEGAAVPKLQKGRKKGYKKYPDGQIAVSKLEDQPLQELASAFNTRYIRLDAQFKNLNPLRDQIKRLSSAPLATKRERVKNNKYQFFLLISFLTLGFSMFYMPVQKQ